MHRCGERGLRGRQAGAGSSTRIPRWEREGPPGALTGCWTREEGNERRNETGEVRQGEERGLVTTHLPQSGARSRRGGILGSSAAPSPALVETSGSLGGGGGVRVGVWPPLPSIGLRKDPWRLGEGLAHSGACSLLAHQHGRVRLAMGWPVLDPPLTEFVFAQIRASSSRSLFHRSLHC